MKTGDRILVIHDKYCQIKSKWKLIFICTLKIYKYMPNLKKFKVTQKV